MTVVIVGISNHPETVRKLYTLADDGGVVVRGADNLNAYLVPAPNVVVTMRSKPDDDRAIMQFGNHPYYGAALIFSRQEARELIEVYPEASHFVRPLYGSKEFISAAPRACLWIEEKDHLKAQAVPPIAQKIAEVAKSRRAAKQDKAAQKLAETPYRFRDQVTAKKISGGRSTC